MLFPQDKYAIACKEIAGTLVLKHDLVTFDNELVSCGIDLLTHGNEILSCGNNLLIVGKNLLSCGNDFLSCKNGNLALISVVVALNPANENIWDGALSVSPDMSLAFGMNMKIQLFMLYENNFRKDLMI